MTFLEMYLCDGYWSRNILRFTARRLLGGAVGPVWRQNSVYMEIVFHVYD